MSVTENEITRPGTAIPGVPPIMEVQHPDESFENLIMIIRELHRQRDDLLRAEGDLTRRLKSIDRRASVGQNLIDTHYKVAENARKSNGEARGHRIHGAQARDASSLAAPALVAARAAIHEQKLIVEKHLKAHAIKLPVWKSFGEQVRGFGIIGLAQIVGEAGDLSNYANPAKLWKRFGLAVMPDGQQRKHKDAALAVLHGYSPRRRAVMHVIGDSMLRNCEGYWRKVYDDNKKHERAKAAKEGLTVAPSVKIQRMSVADRAKCRSDGHIHNRALRYLEKRLLLKLWQAWRDENEET